MLVRRTSIYAERVGQGAKGLCITRAVCVLGKRGGSVRTDPAQIHSAGINARLAPYR